MRTGWVSSPTVASSSSSIRGILARSEQSEATAPCTSWKARARRHWTWAHLSSRRSRSKAPLPTSARSSQVKSDFELRKTLIGPWKRTRLAVPGQAFEAALGEPWPRAAGNLLARDRPIPQQADVLDLDFNHVTSLERPGRARRAGIDDIAWLERDVAAEVADHVGDVENQIPGSLRLDDLAVETRLQQQVIVVHAGDDGGTERCEGVRSLRAEPLQVLLLPVTLADVVADRHPEHVRLRVRGRHVFRALAYDDDELAFIVHVLRVGRNHDVLVVRDNRARVLREETGVFRGRPLAEVRLVVQAD